MLNQMIQIIKKNNLIDKGDKIVVAVSGGADSTALLHGLHSIKNDYDLELYVCHLNHQLRGEDADGDATYVKKLSDLLGLKSYIFSKDIENLAKDMKMSFEEAAREVRYELFDYVLKETGSNKVAVAQNMNDQAETILMRLFRGSGLEGLTATKFKRGHIIRPLLGIRRRDIEKYCKEHDLMYRTDHTNFETDYTRNKIRLELIPYIEKNFNEKVIEKLFDTTQLLTEDLRFIETYVEDVYNRCVKKESVLLSDLELENAILSRVLRKIIDQQVSLKGVSYESVKEIMDMVRSQKHGNEKNVKGLVFKISYKQLLFYKKCTNGVEPTLFDRYFDYNGNRLEQLDSVDSNSRDIVTVDRDKIKGSLFIRTRKPGDRFSPLNMKGTKKLKDFLIDQKVPVHRRDDVLLLCDEEQIIWVAGYRLSDLYKVDSHTKNKISFKLSKIPE
ncbi:MAG: tRNA lysidine(34) synthetase TilS [Clostridiales bacterium]|nr:tRNA lysidine(34) synthetase TilS [Clostridiales bacterium]